MREKYESLPLATLRDLAKAREMTGISTLKKAELIEAMQYRYQQCKRGLRQALLPDNKCQ